MTVLDSKGMGVAHDISWVKSILKGTCLQNVFVKLLYRILKIIWKLFSAFLMLSVINSGKLVAAIFLMIVSFWMKNKPLVNFNALLSYLLYHGLASQVFSTNCVNKVQWGFGCTLHQAIQMHMIVISFLHA